jgi:hypothetical protein
MARFLACLVALVACAAPSAFAEPLKPAWSKPHSEYGRLVGVEEFGRCVAFADSAQIRLVSPSGDVAWSWPYKQASRYLIPRRVAVSQGCDAIALVGDASYKYAWVVDRAGSASIKFAVTPADVAFDRKGALVAVGTYAGSLYLYSRTGALQWQRDTGASIVNDLEFTDDNERILFKGWGGVGAVSIAGHVEWSTAATHLAVSRDLRTLVLTTDPGHGGGRPSYAVTDARRQPLWNGDGGIGAIVSGNGDRVLLDLAGAVQLVTRDRTVLNEFPNYSAIAFSEDGALAWLWREDAIECFNETGDVLASINAVTKRGEVKVSRNFSQVVVARQVNGKPASVEWYDVPPACRRP